MFRQCSSINKLPLPGVRPEIIKAVSPVSAGSFRHVVVVFRSGFLGGLLHDRAEGSVPYGK